MNSVGGKLGQQERKNFTSKVHHADANTITPLNRNKPNTLANHVGSASAMSDLSGKAFCASVFGKGM